MGISTSPSDMLRLGVRVPWWWEPPLPPVWLLPSMTDSAELAELQREAGPLLEAHRLLLIYAAASDMDDRDMSREIRKLTAHHLSQLVERLQRSVDEKA